MGFAGIANASTAQGCDSFPPTKVTFQLSDTGNPKQDTWVGSSCPNFAKALPDSSASEYNVGCVVQNLYKASDTDYELGKAFDIKVDVTSDAAKEVSTRNAEKLVMV